MGVVGFFLVLIVVPVFLFKRTLHLKKNSAHSIDKVLKIAESQIKSGRAVRVISLLRPFESKGVGGFKMHLCYVQALRLSGKHQEALDKIERVVEAYPTHLLIYKELGKVCLTLGDFERAKDAFLEALSVLQGEDEFLEFASACFQSGDVSLAWKYLQPFLKMTSNGRLISLAADCLFIQKNFTAAIPLYKKAVGLGWVNHKLMNRLGHSYRLTNAIPEAEATFQRLLSEDRQDIVAALGLGMCFEARGLHAKALILYQQDDIWSLNDERLIKRAGICAHKVGKHQAAVAYLKAIIEKETSNLTLMSYYASSLAYQGAWNEAESMYQEICKKFPQMQVGFRGIAWLYGIGKGATPQEYALRSAMLAVKIKEDRASLEILSACLARAGDYDQAHRILESLSSESESKDMRLRRLRAMRTLRRQQPLEKDLVAC